MSNLSTASFSNLMIHEGIEEVPTISITLNDNKQYGYPQDIVKLDLAGYSGFIDKVVGQTLYMKVLDPQIYQKFESRYLGNTLHNAIQALNLKSDIDGEFPSVEQDFYMVNERPWHAFVRLSRYLPPGYYLACLCDKIKIFQAPSPGKFKEIYVSEYVTQADYTAKVTGLIGKMKSDSESGNPHYGGLISMPLSKMMHSDILTSSGTNVINNYMDHYLNRNNYFPENLMFQSTSASYEIGDGVMINNTNFMIISKSFSMSSSAAGGAAYRCIKVD